MSPKEQTHVWICDDRGNVLRTHPLVKREGSEFWFDKPIVLEEGEYLRCHPPEEGRFHASARPREES